MSIFDWTTDAIMAIGAFFVSDTFLVVLFWLFAPYVVTWIALVPCHRPWASGSWKWRPRCVAGAAVVLVVLLLPGYPLAVWDGWEVWLKYLPWWLALYVVLACIGPAWLAFKVSERINRACRIVKSVPGKEQEFEIAPPPLGQRPPTLLTGRRIVLFCDGTSNRPDQLSEGISAPTNVYKLYTNLVKNEAQTGWYDPGVGTETSSESLVGKKLGAVAQMVGWLRATPFFGAFVKIRTILEAGFGVGITENIVQAYTEIVRQYRPGDRIYLIGFSRGAYTARCVAGVIRRCGLLRPENIRYSKDVVRLFSMRQSAEMNVPIDPSFVHQQLPAVEFLGLFDTVGSLGVPMWGWWFNARTFFRNTPLSTDPSPICINVYHAMAMDERRAQFFPTPFDKRLPSDTWTETLQEVWFRGAHCDVGGGYADPGLSDLALEWMLDACEQHRLAFDPGLRRSLRGDPLARLHDELQNQRAWRLLGSWPRWHPVATSLHPSVAVRAAAIADLGRHDMTIVKGSKKETFTASAQREWDRTGLILLGRGERYRLTWLEGEWRDKECPPCGPSGQPGDDWVRRMARWRRRLPDENYMTLCITITHPRPWPLREGSLGRLFSYLFVRDPAELVRQIAPVGRDLTEPNKSVVIQNNGDAGLLHIFANDAWMTAANNSGGLVMTIEHLDYRQAIDEPLWTFAPTVRRRSAQRGRRKTEGKGWIPADLQSWRWRKSA